MTDFVGHGSRSWLGVPILLFLDALCVLAALSLSAILTMASDQASLLFTSHTLLLISIIAVTIFCFFIFDLYYVARDFRRLHQFINLISSLFIATLILIFLAYLDRSFALGKRAIFLFVFLMFFFTLIIRSLFSILHKKYFFKTGIIIGNAPITKLLTNVIGPGEEGRYKHGIHIIGYIADAISDNMDVPYLGSVDSLDKILASRSAQLIIYAINSSGDDTINELLIKEKLKGTDLITAVGLYQAITGRTPYEHIDSSWLIEDCLRGQKFTEIRIKRLFDILAGALLFALSIPVVALSCIIIGFESKGSAFFIQERIGRFGKSFKIYKLRTMTCPAELDTPKHGEWGNLYEENISKITRFGKFLRKYHIDELPQFLNVIKGDMSIVGPRPEMEMFTHRCEERIPFYRLRLAIRPGVTGWAQVWFAHTSTLSGYKNKFEYDLYYLANLSLRLDFEIIIRTVFRIFGYPRERTSANEVTE